MPQKWTHRGMYSGGVWVTEVPWRHIALVDFFPAFRSSDGPMFMEPSCGSVTWALSFLDLCAGPSPLQGIHRSNQGSRCTSLSGWKSSFLEFKATRMALQIKCCNEFPCPRKFLTRAQMTAHQGVEEETMQQAVWRILVFPPVRCCDFWKGL